MSLNHSPSIITNGLIFGYDQLNIKSYRGPAMQNLANQISILGTGTDTGYSSTAITETVDIPQLGLTTVYSNVIQNNYTSYSPNSGNCCPSLQGWGSFVVSPSTLYTYAIVYRCDSGYTNPNYMYRYEFTSNEGSYVTEGGVHNASNRVHLGGEWYYAWGTFTTQATTNWIGHAGTFYYRHFNLADKLSIAKVMIVAGNYSGLHPKYWPNQATTRSNTQAILDLTNRSTNTTNNLLYNSDGTFNFVGGDATSTITVPLSTAFNKLTGTIGMWVNPSSYSGSNGLFVNRDVNTANATDWFWIGSWDSANVFYFRLGNGSDCCSNDLTVSSWASFCPTNTWTYVTCSWTSAGTSRIYTNGILRASRSISAIPATNPSATGRIGLGHEAPASWNGKIAVTQIYNRQLTDSEILSNFNSMRGRFNI